ncbi:adenylate/guanylate cyclase domain-containing protein [Microvirga sp. P5_D2]
MERKFVEVFSLSQRPYVQAAMFLGSTLYYVFFIWDRIIDPGSWEITHAIRGAITLFVWVCAVLLFLQSLQRHLEIISTASVTVSAVGLSVIYSILASGFDYGAIGLVLVILFGFSLLPIRILYFTTFCVLSWASFVVCEVLATNSKPGMIIVNNMSIGTAVALGMLSACLRELSARRQFTTSHELEASRLRVEELLHSMLPKEIVARIQAGETAIADAYGEVSIVFADLVGFTELARRVSPTHLVEVLNELFSRFDLEAERHGIEKIKTIGDAYMAVGGLSERRGDSDHADRAAKFALAIQGIVAELSDRMDYPMKIRVGLHVGPIVAGVIGTKRPAFDCWGEAVNLASRLEHSAAPGGILISESAYWRLRSHFPTKILDDVDLKGIGPAKVFLLQSQIPDGSCAQSPWHLTRHRGQAT